VLQDTSGAKGFRGGLDSFVSAMNLAKETAETTDVNTYVGFPPPAFGSTPDIAHSHFVLFREMTYDEENDPGRDKSLPPVVPLSTWIKLPAGIVVDLSRLDFQGVVLDAAYDKYHTVLPRLEGKDVQNLRLIQYNRYGSIINKPLSEKTAFVPFGEGVVEGGKAKVFGKNTANLTVSRLTGKWSMSNP